MTGVQLLEHSPLGASGAYQWMVCPGSVQLSQGIDDDDSEYAAEGRLAHTVAEKCLTQHMEPWQLIGQDGVDKEMADAVQQYVSWIQQWHPERNQVNSWVERRFHCPEIHDYFYGTSDFVMWAEAKRHLDVWDYKHGAGIVVEAKDNPQLMYYAIGVLEDLIIWDDVDTVTVHIAQPRAWHADGPHRHWTTSTDALSDWLMDDLVPAMNRALVDTSTTPGSHCRFCPARGAQCPSILNAIQEYWEMVMLEDKEGAAAMTPEQMGKLLELHELAKLAVKRVQKVAYGQLSNGHVIPGLKLVNSRTNRKFKEGAEKAAQRKFGKKDAFTAPELKSPAQIDSLPGGKEFTARWAFKPEGGTTIALDSDPRRALNRDVKSLFQPVKRS